MKNELSVQALHAVSWKKKSNSNYQRRYKYKCLQHQEWESQQERKWGLLHHSLLPQ